MVAPLLELLPKIYPITDVRISRLSHAAQVERLVAGGAEFVQLRDKTASARSFYEAALEAVQIARRAGVRIIINDRVDIALAVGADGVHLGQTDLPPEKARVLLGEGRIIGFSTHSFEQAMAADSLPVDYIAVGPIFQTSTKENPDDVVCLEMIERIKRCVSKPVVAIGGITYERARAVADAGADSLAIISGIVAADDIAGRMRDLLNLFD
ncbi:MAG: thiamine phosphate synthase [Blastocatellia bacterium]|nr:thiamine phosphate synthase [Blastocatellia bacterium]